MQVSFQAEIREKLGTSEARRIKKQHKIPAVIYDPKAGNINITINRKEFETEYSKGNILASVVSLNYGGKETKAIVGEIEFHPVSDAPIHINFIPCEKDKEIVVQLKVLFENREKSPGIKKGGFLHVVARLVKVLCVNEQSIPKSITIDVGAMHIGHKIRSESISLPEGVRFLKRDNFLIGSIIGRGKSEDDKATTPEAAAATAAPASTAADKKPAAKK